MEIHHKIMLGVALIAVMWACATIYDSYNEVRGHCDLCETDQEDSCISYENVTRTWCLGEMEHSRDHGFGYQWAGWYAYGSDKYDAQLNNVAKLIVYENGSREVIRRPP